MKNIFLSLLVYCATFTFLHGDDQASRLREIYEDQCQNPSDINEHLPVLKQLAYECSSVAEIGIRWIVSSWGLVQGLSENSYIEKSYLGIDLVNPPGDRLQLLKQLSEANGIKFTFWRVNDMEIELEPVDLLFIDSLHTYCHLTYELETFSSSVNKYICMHDTSEPWGSQNDSDYHGDYSEYPYWCDRTKRGLWQAVVDFLENHPEWVLHKRLTNNHGFTILKRKD